MDVKVLVELSVPEFVGGAHVLTPAEAKHFAAYVENTIELDLNDEESIARIGSKRRRKLVQKIKDVSVRAVISL